jgi:uncharacterized C2H2 Zn-finger protein
MTPYKPKKKTPEVARHNQAIENPDVAHKETTDDNERLLADQLADLALPGDQATPVGIQNAPAWTTPQSPEPVSVRADDLPPLPEKPQPEPKPDPPPQTPDAKPTEQVTLSEAAGAGTVALDKLLSELDQDEDIVTPARPGEPFRSRCPGCRTVFRNVRSDDYDKHARCKKCSTRFHLGDHLVV